MTVAGVILFSLWFAAGLGPFVYFWTSQFDLAIDDLCFAAFLSIFMGPAFGLLSWGVFSEKRPPRVVMRKRSKK